MTAVEDYLALRINGGPRNGKRLLSRVLKLFLSPFYRNNDYATRLKTKLEGLCSNKAEIYSRIHFYFYVTHTQVRNIITYIKQINEQPYWLRPLTDAYFYGFTQFIDKQLERINNIILKIECQQLQQHIDEKIQHLLNLERIQQHIQQQHNEQQLQANSEQIGQHIQQQHIEQQQLHKEQILLPPPLILPPLAQILFGTEPPKEQYELSQPEEAKYNETELLQSPKKQYELSQPEQAKYNETELEQPPKEQYESEQPEQAKCNETELEQPATKSEQNIAEPPKKKRKVFSMPQMNMDYFWEQEELLQQQLHEK